MGHGTAKLRSYYRAPRRKKQLDDTEDKYCESRNGVVYRKKSDALLFYVPREIEKNILFKNNVELGHIGSEKCIAYAPSMGKVEGFTLMIPKGTKPFETIHIDHEDIVDSRVPGQGYLSFAVPVRGHPDKFVVGCGKNVLMIKWDGSTEVHSTRSYFIKSLDQLPDNPIPEGNRLSYASVDPEGTLWFATTNDNPANHENNLGSVYTLTKSRKLIIKLTNLRSVTGGFVWDQPRTNEQPLLSKFYYADTLNHQIIAYDFTIHSGKPVRLGEVFHNIYANPGQLAIDTRGFLWIPLLGVGGVQEFDPFTQSPLRFIPIPAKQVGGCTFGGRYLQTLYVSTIRYEFKEPHGEIPPNDEGGCVYAIHGLGVTGVPIRDYILAKAVLLEAFEALDGYKPRPSRERKSQPRNLDLNFSLH
ncbi:regucalcin-like [Belonocnema kinseyi]|uniref:regucalcin-like n=1 Tax=Belonocnema kinseyi TaxID=2817044 RepID=UPI00143D6CF2|nr:regucalcin-like [Belonocnema kinseyi]